jgi:hypothetical protein
MVDTNYPNGTVTGYGKFSSLAESINLYFRQNVLHRDVVIDWQHTVSFVFCVSLLESSCVTVDHVTFTYLFTTRSNITWSPPRVLYCVRHFSEFAHVERILINTFKVVA